MGDVIQIKKILIGEKSNIQKKIKQDLDNSLAGVNNNPDESLKNQLSQVSNIKVQNQKYNNCSTRCIREALRDNIPTKEFRELYEFITKNSYSDILEMARLKELTKQKEIKNLDSEFKEYTQFQRGKFDETQNNLKKEKRNKLSQKLKELMAQSKELRAQYTKTRDKTILKENIELLKQNEILKEQEKLLQNPTNTSLNMKNHISNFRDQGFNILTKQQLLNEIANQYSEELGKERSQNLWLKLFKESLNDIDLPLTKELIEPVKRHFSNCLDKSSDDNEIFNKWKKECIEDFRIDPIIKAPIIKLMIENKEDLPKSIKHYAKSDNAEIKNLKVNDIYKNLLKENIAQRDIKAAHRQQEMEEAKRPHEKAYERYIEAEASKKTLDDIKKTLDSHFSKKQSSPNIGPNLKKQESNESNAR